MTKQTHQDKPAVPRLSQEVKNLNGKSGKKLSKCIDTLCEILDEEPKQPLPEKDVDSEG